jgi:hypothetical protein
MRCTLMNTYEHLSQYLAKLFLEWDMFQINLLGNIKVCFLLNIFFRKSWRLWDVENMVEPDRPPMSV